VPQVIGAGSPLRDQLWQQSWGAEAVAWLGDRTAQAAYAECNRADWLLWLFARTAGAAGCPTKEDVLLTLCACAEVTKPWWPAGDSCRHTLAAIRTCVRDNTIREMSAVAMAALDTAFDYPNTQGLEVFGALTVACAAFEASNTLCRGAGAYLVARHAIALTHPSNTPGVAYSILPSEHAELCQLIRERLCRCC
jgi:hypothetical protein